MGAPLQATREGTGFCVVAGSRFRRGDGNLKMGGVHDAVSLELHPDPIDARTRGYEAELQPGAAIGNRGVRKREPLVYRHAFLFRKPLSLPAGTAIRGARHHARIMLIPATRTTR